MENWTGWKRLIVPFSNPTLTSAPATDLARINSITIGFWASFNVAGKFLLDDITVDTGKWIEINSTKSPHQLLINMFGRNNQSFSMLPENNITTLASGEVYFFPYTPYISQTILTNLVQIGKPRCYLGVSKSPVLIAE